MFKKLAIASCLSLGALTFGSAQADLITCPANVANAVSGDIGCQYSTLQPANEGEATITNFVNSEEYFTNDDWVFAGSLNVGAGASGTWSLAGFNTSTWDDVMLVFKSGTNPLIGYLLGDATSGTWSTPFLEPPFELPGNATQQNVSFIRVFFTTGQEGPGPGPEPGGKVPEPATLGLLGIGLLGLFALRRRRQ